MGGCLLPSRAFSYKQCHKSTRAHDFCLLFSCSHARKSFQAQLTMAILPGHKNSVGTRDSPWLQVCLQCLSRRLTTSAGEGCPLKAYILYAFEFWFVCSICFNKGTSLWLIQDWRLSACKTELEQTHPYDSVFGVQNSGQPVPVFIGNLRNKPPHLGAVLKSLRESEK
jgi:hypothetical protein